MHMIARPGNRIAIFAYHIDVTWVSWRPKASPIRLFAQQLHANSNENVKTWYYHPLWWHLTKKVEECGKQLNMIIIPISGTCFQYVNSCGEWDDDDMIHNCTFCVHMTISVSKLLPVALYISRPKTFSNDKNRCHGRMCFARYHVTFPSGAQKLVLQFYEPSYNTS